ncbi:MAG: sugar ABC transporter permease [Planctomycetota bacterium]
MSPAGSGLSRLTPWLLTGPFLVIFAVFTVVPLLQSIPLAMSHTFGPSASVPVGLDNFRSALDDPRFWTAIRNTFYFTAGSVFIQLPLALGLAMLLNRRGLRGKAVFRLLFFSPQLVGLVFVGVIAAIAFQKQSGLINVTLAHAVAPFHEMTVSERGTSWFPAPAVMLGIPWLETLALPTLIITALWMYTGFNMIYFLAALQNVSQEQIDAAVIDGAGPLSRFVNITLPAISPVLLFVVLLSIIGSFQLFELPFIMLPEGVGLQDRGLTIVTYLFKSGFEAGDLGYAAAIGWMLALLLAGFGIAQRLAGRQDSLR